MAPPRKTRLTDAAVQAMRETEAPGTVKALENIPDLSVRFGSKSATYVTIVRRPGDGKQRWVTIGRIDRISLKDAEARSIVIAERIRAGAVVKEILPGHLTLNQLVEAYRVKTGQHQHRWRDKERRLKTWVLPTLGKVPFLELTRSQVNKVLDDIEENSKRKSTRVADQVLVDIQALEKHFLKMKDVPEDYGIRFRDGLIPPRGKAVARDRILSHEELAAVWFAAGNAGRFGIVLKLCLYSAQRIAKILSMKWDHLNLETGDWSIPHVKGQKGVPKILRLPPAAVALIETQLTPEGVPLAPYVFHSVRGYGHMTYLSDFKRDFATGLPLVTNLIGKKSVMEPWVVHDLRRTARSEMDAVKIKIGDEEVRAIDPWVAERIMGHVLSGVLGTYAKHDYRHEMGVALARLADHLHQIVAAHRVPAATTATTRTAA
jgi:integrase